MAYRLLGPSGTYASASPGALGGNSRARIYGRLDCSAALRGLPRGVYQTSRVFFADEATAVASGYRPCGTCMRDAYNVWKATTASG